MTPQLLRDLLTRAQSEEMGLVVGCSSPHKLEIEVHNIRKNTSEFDDIMFVIPNLPETVMLVKKSVELDAPVWDEGDLPDV